MSVVTAPNEIALLKEAGKRLAFTLEEIEKLLRPGVRTAELSQTAYTTITARGDTPAFLDYQPSGADYPFPATVCISVNDELVHGIPRERTLQEGDIVGLDIGLRHGGLVVDMARTVAVGAVDEESQRLMTATQKALDAGIRAAQAGSHVGDIGAAIERSVAGTGFSIVSELGGHGVGRHVHEPPFIPNTGTPGAGTLLEKGMVLAIEPILVAGKPVIKLADDGYTYKTRDGSRAAHFEHTIRINEDGQPEIITVNR